MADSLLEREFPLDASICYLNHAAISPWPRRTAQAVETFADENLHHGATNYARWIATESKLRGQFQQLINAPSKDDIALLKNTSEALSFVANGIEWRSGDNVVSTDEEFPSNRIVWQALAPKGVHFKQVSLIRGSSSPEEAIMAACDEYTRLVSVSSVQFASGLRLDLDTLGGFCEKHRILFCIDAIQSLGAVSLDVKRCQADFVMADAHKWLIGPEGIALFYVKARVREQMQLSEYGWHMVQDLGDYDRGDWRPASNARRFECGSPNMLGIHACSASLSLLLDVGINAIERMVLDNTSLIIDAIQQCATLELVGPPQIARRAGIVSFINKRQHPSESLSLLKRNGVVCAVRGGAVRFSPHFYTPREKIEFALSLAAKP